MENKIKEKLIELGYEITKVEYSKNNCSMFIDCKMSGKIVNPDDLSSFVFTLYPLTIYSNPIKEFKKWDCINCYDFNLRMLEDVRNEKLNSIL